MRPRNLIAALLVILLSSVVVGATAMHADEGDGTVVRTFVDAVNKGDMATVVANSSASLRVILPDGTVYSLNGGQPLPPAFLPITIVSLGDEGQGSRTMDGVLQLGSFGTWQVQVQGDNGVIVVIRILGPA